MKTIGEGDTAPILKLMWEAWNDAFRRALGQQIAVSSANCAPSAANGRTRSRSPANCALDSAGRLLTAVSAPQSAEIEKMKMELLRFRFDEQVRTEKRVSAVGTTGVKRTDKHDPKKEID